jgi:hypothetical protein
MIQRLIARSITSSAKVEKKHRAEGVDEARGWPIRYELRRYFDLSKAPDIGQHHATPMNRTVIAASILLAPLCGGCGSSPIPTAPSTAAPQGSAAPSLPGPAIVTFTDRVSRTTTPEARDANGDIVQFTRAGELMWMADGTRFQGYRWPVKDDHYILAPSICSYCAYEIRFGTEDGVRRAFVTLDRGENNPGTVVDLKVVNGELVTTETSAGPPGSFTLTGLITEDTAAGAVPVAGAYVGRWRTHYNHVNAISNTAGFYRIPWVDVGTSEVIAMKDGFQQKETHITIGGDTRLDLSMKRQ